MVGLEHHHTPRLKWALMALTHNLARFVAEKEISVNCLSPGVIAETLPKTQWLQR